MPLGRERPDKEQDLCWVGIIGRGTFHKSLVGEAYWTTLWTVIQPFKKNKIWDFPSNNAGSQDHRDEVEAWSLGRTPCKQLQDRTVMWESGKWHPCVIWYIKILKRVYRTRGEITQETLNGSDVDTTTVFLKQHIQVTLVSISFALEMQPILKHLSKTQWSNLTLMGARKTGPQRWVTYLLKYWLSDFKQDNLLCVICQLTNCKSRCFCYQLFFVIVCFFCGFCVCVCLQVMVLMNSFVFRC